MISVFDPRCGRDAMPELTSQRSRSAGATREYDYSGNVLSYAVPASASGNGTIAYSVWRKVAPKN